MKVEIIDIDLIEFGDRQRDDYGDIGELAHSIKTKGIITPLAVQVNPDGEKPYLLVAGGRRYKACNVLKMDKVPVRIYTKVMSEIDFREVELFENIHRKELGWAERVKMERDIHNLQVEKYGEKISTNPDADGHSIRDTGDIIGKSGEHVRQSIVLANAVESFPELFDRCRTKADASKVCKAMGEEMIKKEIAKRIRSEKNDDKRYSLSDNFILKSFFHGAVDIPDNSINLVEIDPPYAIDIIKAKKSKDDKSHQYGDSYNEIDVENYPDFMQKTLNTCYRIMAEHSWLIVWFAPEPWFADMYQWIIDAGFSCKRMCGMWTKPPGQNKRPELQLANSYEMFFYAKKGNPAIAKAHGNIFNTPPVPPQKKVHPTERPIELMKELYSTFAFEGSNIVIPFLGSGNGIIAAREVNMNAVGFELGRDYKDSFLVRLHQEG